MLSILWDPDALLDLIELPLSGVHGLEEKTRKGVSAWRMEGVFREFPGNQNSLFAISLKETRQEIP